LKKLEQRLSSHDGTITLEELCRAMWRKDKRKFSEIARGTNLRLFVRQFELEEVERGDAERQSPRAE
jgi:hypothetical protein